MYRIDDVVVLVSTFCLILTKKRAWKEENKVRIQRRNDVEGAIMVRTDQRRLTIDDDKRLSPRLFIFVIVSIAY